MTAFAKTDFTDIYNAATPVPFYRTLAPLRYRSPDFAFDPLRTRCDAMLADRGEPGPLRVIDLACSYGINSHLLRWDVTFADVAKRYMEPAFDRLSDADVLAADRRAFGERRVKRDVEVVGVDISEAALDYGVAAGLLHASVSTNLELEDPTDEDQRNLAGADLIIATGALSYVGEPTLAHLLAEYEDDALPPFLAWAIFGTDTSELRSGLERRGYTVTESSRELGRQRDYENAKERDEYHHMLTEKGIAFEGTPAQDGLCVSRFEAAPPHT